MIKKYYKIRFRLLEPLCIGNGDNRYSDTDVLRNGKGIPFIPGTSLCGVYRTCVGKDAAEKYFGMLLRPADDTQPSITASSVLVYDAVPEGYNYTVSIRDSVGLDEFKTAKDGAKFDFELVEPGAVFVTYLEQNMASAEESDIGEELADRLYGGQITLGRRTSRGYGRIEATDIWRRTFELPEQEQIEAGLDEPTREKMLAWLAFDMYAPEAFSQKDYYEKKDVRPADKICLELHLKLRGGISIRQYTTDLGKDENNQPDYTQMAYKTDNGEEIPYIPGTTWSGAFRHHIASLLPTDQRDAVLNPIFGSLTGEENLYHKSRIRFSESRLTGKKMESKTVTRNAIDRFTGGTIDGALYTEKSFFGGTTVLRIEFPRYLEKNNRQWHHLIAAAITDLDEGFLSVGGLTAIGRGLFEVTGCQYNGTSIYDGRKSDTEETPVLYSRLMEVMEAPDNIEMRENGV